MPKPPPEIMLCNECRGEGVSETFRHTKICLNLLLKSCYAIKSRANKFSSAKNKSITHDLATASRRKKAVLAKLIQGDPKQPIYFIMNQFGISKLAFEQKFNRLYQASDSARG